MKAITLILLFYSLTGFSLLFAEVKINIQNCELKAGFDDAVPFHYRSKTERIVGSDADLLRTILNQIGCEIEFVELPWARTLSWTKRGKIDIAIGAAYKDQRAKWAYYSAPYKFIQHKLYTLESKHSEMESVETLLEKGGKLGVVIGWGYPPGIRIQLEKPKFSRQIIKTATFNQLTKMLDKDRLDGIIANPKMLRNSLKTENYRHKFTARAHYQEKLHFMFSKKSVTPKTVADFNNKLYQLIYNGEQEKIFKKHIGNH